MDAPDPVVRSAMAKAMNPQGLPPMTQKELNRLLGRQYLEAEDRKNQAQNATLQTMRMRQDIAAGEVPAVDVRQYAGSMYAAPGSYSAARPLRPTGGSIIERSADELLKSRFGQMVPGQIAVAPTNLPTMQAQPTPQAGYGYIQGRYDYLGTTPLGMVRSAEPVLGDQFQQLSGAMQASQQVDASRSPWDALPPIQPALMLGKPQEVEAPAPQAVQEVSGFSGNTAIERLLGRNLSLMQGAGTAQPMGAPTPSNVFSYTPAAMAQQLGQRRFEADYAADQRKQMIETVSAMYGQGQDINQLNLPPDILSEAVVRGEKIRNEISRKYPASKSIIRDGVVYTQRYNPETGEELGDLIPIRSTQNLPGSARPQSKGQLVPAIDKTTGQPIPNLYLDTDTGQLRSTAPLSERASLLSDTGFGGFNQTQTGKPTTTGVRTYEQLVREMQGAAK